MNDATGATRLILWNDQDFYDYVLNMVQVASEAGKPDDVEHVANLLQERFDTFGTGLSFADQFARLMAGRIMWHEIAREAIRHYRAGE